MPPTKSDITAMAVSMALTSVICEEMSVNNSLEENVRSVFSAFAYESENTFICSVAVSIYAAS